MGILRFPLLLSISILSLIFVNDVVHGKCLEDQSLALVEFKQNITFSQYLSSLLSWNSSTDCCSWAGITCEDGLVVGLDLSNEYISGNLDNSSSLFKLQHLRSLNLASANFSTSIPSAIGQLENLMNLDLSWSSFFGQIPMEISRLTKLRTLNLSSFSTGALKLEDPKLKILQNLSKLQELRLDGVDISSPVPKSFANFSNLISLSLVRCNLVGKFPEEIFRIPSLKTLDLSQNDLLGGSLPEFIQEGSFRSLDLRDTNFSGSLPKSIGKLSMLFHMHLANCTFSGPIPNSLANLSQLVSVDLSYNSFSGSIPSSLFNLSQLDELDLSFNHFSGTIHLKSLQNMANLGGLAISYNSLSIETSSNNSSFSKAFPSLRSLMLASCKLKTFPNFRNHSRLSNIDFSDNQIGGDIPSWIWELNNLFYLNLSHNLLVNLHKPFGIPAKIGYLDLNSNDLQGEIPIPPQGAFYVDYSSNHFSSSIPVDILGDFSPAWLLSVSNNNLTGNIPESICKSIELQVLDLSQNNLSGRIPSCLVERINKIAVLNLAENNLGGNISGTFLRNCGLQTLDLHGNHLQGMIPESLSKCQMLEVLNLGNNMIEDIFPCWLKNLANLRVLILRSNRFQGNLHCLEANQSWKNLQIIDLASNNFSGVLPTKGFLNFKAMMVHEDELNPLHYELFKRSIFYYQEKVKVVSKGLQMELAKILTIYTFIDLSSNMFRGNVPEEIGHLTSLYGLNLSNNALTGQIPSSFGSLKDLESLDLSKNKLHGVIPSQLGGLTFLSVLNLSFNQLEGMIPKGRQLQTFTEASFQGNKGLCGTPLNVKCHDSSPPAYDNVHFGAKIEWNLIAAEIGFAFGLGIFVLLLVFCKKWRKYYYEQVDQFLSRIFNMQCRESGRRGRTRGRKFQRRSIY